LGVVKKEVIKKKFEKKILIYPVFVLLLILTFSFISSAITVVRPLNNTNVTGAFGPLVVFNVSYLNSTEFTDATNVTFYYNLSGIWTRIGSSTSCSKAAAGSLASCAASLNMSGLTDGRYTINATLANTSTNGASSTNNYTFYGATNAIFNFTIDSTPPSAVFAGTIINNGNYSGIIILNASVSDAIMGISSVYFNLTFTNGTQISFTKATNSSSYYNVTINTSSLADGYYNITVFANDTQLNNLNKTERIIILVDNTIPTGTYSCSPTTVTSSGIVDCSCSYSDTLSGINPLLVSYTSKPSVAITGTFTLNCSFSDYAGNFGSVVTNYTVNSPQDYSGSSSSSGGGSPTKTNSFTKITPGVASIMKDFGVEGIKQIQIEVNNEAKNVIISIIKYDNKPANISIEKTDVYTYLQVKSLNLADKLNRAVITIEVKKSWLSEKKLNKTEISLYKYNESTSKWDELPTFFKEEDSIYDYYDAEVKSFSYFAIAPSLPSIILNEEEQPAREQEPVTTSSIANYWWWIIGGIILLVLIISGSKLFKKKRKLRRK
jgi:PGF-pre-PGF domain-containing protein